MKQSIAHIQFVVRDYDEAIDFFIKKLHFVVLENFKQPEQHKRWVVIAPPGSHETKITLRKAKNVTQQKAIGNHIGGRVLLSLHTDDFWRDYQEMIALGIEFVRPPKEEPYGTVANWKDLYGNLWDLIQYR